ncbi:hypothetical protein BD410DRAFT_462314 [Rickenella mellea]|uniref:Uncharacterized protein n=1 Tax=Rickenella mellea TaxID=50990 RepID=A0A4Y7PVZ5_9AGAM|nr:hypothetical protein BD410DRAFT_462314 [Rickenella mellea]
MERSRAEEMCARPNLLSHRLYTKSTLLACGVAEMNTGAELRHWPAQHSANSPPLPRTGLLQACQTCGLQCSFHWEQQSNSPDSDQWPGQHRQWQSRSLLAASVMPVAVRWINSNSVTARPSWSHHGSSVRLNREICTLGSTLPPPKLAYCGNRISTYYFAHIFTSFPCPKCHETPQDGNQARD